MSSSANGPQDYFPPGISIFGGAPTNPPDLIPSIIFTIAYILLIPLAVYRVWSPKSRTWLLLRPHLFVPIRIVSFIIRIVQAQGTYTVGLFIAELVLVISGFNIICEPVVRVLEQNLHSSAYNAGVKEPRLIIRLLNLMRIGLLVSLILGIYTGTKYGGSLTPSQVESIDQFRLATSGLNVGIVGLTIVLSIGLHNAFSCPKKSTAYVTVVGCMLIIPSAYRLAAVVHTQPILANSTKIYFYVLGSAFEYLAALAFFAVNLNDVFDLEYKHPDNGGGPIGAIVSAVRGPSKHVNHQPYGPHGTAQHHTDMSQHEQGYGGQSLPYGQQPSRSVESHDPEFK